MNRTAFRRLAGARLYVRLATIAALLTMGSALTLVPASAKDNGNGNGGNKGKVQAQILGTTLVVTGSNNDDVITLRLKPGGGAVQVVVSSPPQAAFEFPLSAFDTIRVDGRDGNDTITIDDTNGPFNVAKPTELNGEGGNDTLVGGSGAETLVGGGGDDTLLGKGGNDTLRGGPGNDTLTGGDADDQVFGESGNDRIIWNPGDDTDLNEGGDGIDIVEVNGGNGAETFTLVPNGSRVRFDRVDPAPFALDIGTSESLTLNANGGNDRFSATGNIAALIQVAVDGGTGNDTILGSNGDDLLLGGDGDDFIDGQQGSDTAFLGAGTDVFQWDPGDGSDVVEGQDGADTLLFNGSNAAEIYNVGANGQRVRFTRNIGNIVMDLDDVEKIDVNTLGDTDTFNVGNLSGTDLVDVRIDLGGVMGGTTGDAQADTVVVNGTTGNDIIDIFGNGTSYTVVGLSAQVTVTDSEGAHDSLVVNALGGNDGVTATTVPAGIVKLTLDGGPGDDRLLGSQGVDLFLGGDNNDFVFGDNGNDVALLGAGDDVFQWDPGDGSDVVEGQAGTDTLLFFGSNASENINVVANGGRVLFLRDVGNVTVDLDGVEQLDFRALGGADSFVVGDLTGTDVVRADIDLRGPNGGGDSAADTITVNGTQGPDAFGATGDAGGVTVAGLATTVNIYFPEQANDRLVLNAQGGNDTVDSNSLQADGIRLSVNGGLGDDFIVGSKGNDLVNGGDGDDTVFLGTGNDTFVWNPGDDNDVVEGQLGFDTLLFNGANVAENVNISANGGRVRFFRDVASVVMDLDSVEGITFNALGGADVVVVNDMSGTDLVKVDVDLASVAGTGDAQPDTVIVTGTANDDVILVVGDATGTSVMGLAAVVNITGVESANDRLVVNALAGDDTVEASGLAATAIQFTANGEDGNDVLIGGDGNDVLTGGNGDDVLLGGPGIDILDGGPGVNVVIQ